MIAAHPPTFHGEPCRKTFTVQMVQRAITATYGATRDVSEPQRRRLVRYVACSRNPHAKAYLHHQWAVAIAGWKARKFPPLTGPVIASWYSDAGTTGCGFHATYGIATFVVPCGGQVVLENRATGRAVVATRDDSPGPGVTSNGRTFDLNAATKAALGCSDLCTISYRAGSR